MLHYAWDECLNYIIIQMRVKFSIRRVPQQLNSIFMDEDLHFHTCSPCWSRRILFNLNLPQLQFTTTETSPSLSLVCGLVSLTMQWVGRQWPEINQLKCFSHIFYDVVAPAKLTRALNSCSFAREKSINSIFSHCSRLRFCVCFKTYFQAREDLTNETAESEREKITENGSEFLKSN